VEGIVGEMKDKPDVPCDWETLRCVAARREELGKSIDEMTAILLLTKIGDSLLEKQPTQYMLDIIQHMLVDYREMIIDRIECKYGVKISD
jgi:hypothetical protein